MNIGIIGFGNLGRALASGLMRCGVDQTGEIRICEKDPETRAIAEGVPYFARASEDVGFAIGDCDVVFLTVKAHVFEELAAGIGEGALDGKTVVSFMAGVPLEKLRDLLPAEPTRIVRAMPSLAIASCKGVIGYTTAPPEVAEIFGQLGYAFETEPENIEKVMAFSSCGLGFAAYLIDAFAEAGRAMGFSPEDSNAIASRTFANAVAMGGFRDTVKAVATPGGATEQGIKHMDKKKVYNTVAEAVNRAYERFR